MKKGGKMSAASSGAYKGEVRKGDGMNRGPKPPKDEGQNKVGKGKRK